MLPYGFAIGVQLPCARSRMLRHHLGRSSQRRRDSALRPMELRRFLAASVLLAMGASLAGPRAAVAQLDDSKPPAEVSVLNIPPARIDAAIAKVDGMARDMMRKTGIPGMAVAVVHNDRVVFAKGYGVRKVGTTQAVDTDTVFQLASVSKSVGATVVAAAVGKGI